MFRVPVRSRFSLQRLWVRLQHSSSSIRSTFIEYFEANHGHKYVKSSSVVPLYDPTVPFVNAGMNQFKGVFLGKVAPPCAKAVNSQKCVRVGGKHNDLDVVGTDGHHHTFFEMLGNWSFGDYYKREACQMAWQLLLGPYRMKPENLVVTYFSGDVAIGQKMDTDCRDIWKKIGVAESRLLPRGSRDNFWEMGATGPCGPCTEIHYVNPDGSLTEIWNLVFINSFRDNQGKVNGLAKYHVDTGMGLERMAAILQGVPSNYDTDLFQPLIKAIEKNSKGVPAYSGSYLPSAVVDAAYRRLADHARMISICLADGVFPATSLNLKQIMRKSFKISSDVFQNPKLPRILYDEVVETLGTTYPELVTKEIDAKLIIDHEEQGYAKMRSGLKKKMKDLIKQYPEVMKLSDVELPGFVQGYRDLKETMSKQKSTVIPGELVFKLYDTHGLHEEVIKQIADLNKLSIDNKGFWSLLAKHKTRHKTAIKEQDNRGQLFNEALKTLRTNGYTNTNDQPKYDYVQTEEKIEFKPLKTQIIGILNETLDWIDFLEPCSDRPFYIVTKDTNFYCEEGGQEADRGAIYFNKNIAMEVESVFKLQDFVFHKGYFLIKNERTTNCVYCDMNVEMEIDEERRLKLMQNHTGVHLLNAAVRRVLSKSAVCPTGSSVTENGLSLHLSVYGEKLSQKVMLDVQDLIRESIKCNAPIETRIVDSVQLSREPGVVTIPGETYPEVGLRLVTAFLPLVSKELCCGTHLPSTGAMGEFCVTSVKGAGGQTPCIHALTGDKAKQARELFCRAEKLGQVIDLIDPDRKKEEISLIRNQLSTLCGTGGAPYGEYANCLDLLDSFSKKEVHKNDLALHSIASTEVAEVVSQAASEGRRFVVHFVRCSYLMQSPAAQAVLAERHALPAMLLGCAGGVLVAACSVPQEMVSQSFTARTWLACAARVFGATLQGSDNDHTHAIMTPSKVSLINCEQLVQDAMRVAIKFAQSHTKENTEQSRSTQNRQQN
ncbi:alanine--tRNA ligase, mitochondrial-like [Spodoptera frugiperda]|uniref:Alanine--tRNA ligase n=1 Tax=Spodoptera frugiperda TaxID=7108 RepID=A0A9R0DQA9_SPOFR|nr:alanine--tRNA ligase, mitochondrial-like [Spodoptera frugiperda]